MEHFSNLTVMNNSSSHWHLIRNVTHIDTSITHRIQYVLRIFSQVVKVQSIKIKAPSKSGPKTLRVFKNQPRTLDFSQAEGFESIQDISLTTEQLKGEKEIALKFVKFQDVQNMQFFVKDNQDDEEVTEIELLEIFGCPVATTNMKELKKKG